MDAEKAFSCFFSFSDYYRYPNLFYSKNGNLIFLSFFESEGYRIPLNVKKKSKNNWSRGLPKECPKKNWDKFDQNMM